MTAVHEASLLAERRTTQHELWTWLGVPSRAAHRRVDVLLDRLTRADEALTCRDEVLRWR